MVCDPEHSRERGAGPRSTAPRALANFFGRVAKLDLDPRVSFERRIAAIPTLHQRGIQRFRGRVHDLTARGLLNAGQADVVVEHLLRLAERQLNPANTGNLEDLFCYTLVDTRDPIRAFAQVLADSVKVVPMDEAAPLWPAIRRLSDGKRCTRVADLEGYGAGDKMLITHTMVAYGDPELRVLAGRFVEATLPAASAEQVDREVARMAAQSQHGPSSTFVLARMYGLTLEIAEVYRKAGFSEEQAADAQAFYDVCATFQPEWVHIFLRGETPETEQWSSWREKYLSLRQRLPSELVYQLSSDTLTNFLEGTLESGKWTDALIFFGGVTEASDIPQGLARIVNQYLAEHVALHDRPARELVEAVEEPLQPWGVGFCSSGAIPLPEGPRKIAEIRAQFEAAWARKMKSKAE